MTEDDDESPDEDSADEEEPASPAGRLLELASLEVELDSLDEDMAEDDGLAPLSAEEEEL
ncbi:MAG: hypothetical protein HW401_234 [Parcubacteria group bacterium]|nr:hypothetical protein [Parcubacteria group bacterium]